MDASSVLVLAADEDRPLARPFIDAIASRGLTITHEGVAAEAAVLIASPRAAASRDVEQRLVDFVRTHGPGSLLLVLVAGALEWDADGDRFDAVSSTALSPSAQQLFPTRPLWLDARRGASAELTSRLVASLARPAAGAAPAEPAAASPVLTGAPPPTARRAGRRRSLPLVIGAMAFLAVAFFAVLLMQRGGGGGSQATTSVPGGVPTTLGPPTTVGPPTTPSPTSTETPESENSKTSPLWFLVPGVAVGLLIGLAIAWPRRRRVRPAPAVQPAVATQSVWAPPRATTAGPRPTVFISHDVDTDHSVAEQLAAGLRERVDVWLAPESIPAGEPWLTEIERGLKVSAVFLALLSRASLASPWVVKEIQAAMELEVQHRLRLVPVQIEECDVPLLLRTYQILRLAAGYPVIVEQTVRLASTMVRQ